MTIISSRSLYKVIIKPVLAPKTGVIGSESYDAYLMQPNTLVYCGNAQTKDLVRIIALEVINKEYSLKGAKPVTSDDLAFLLQEP